MHALFITIALFSFWMLLGSSVLRATKLGLAPLTELLLSPALGVAMTLILVFSLNRIGLPVSRFAIALFFGLFTFSLATQLLHRKRSHPEMLYQLATVSVFLFIALGLSGWPFLFYDADWLSYANNDMANYSLLARRFIDHGFFEVPPAEQLFSGKHYEQTFWLQGLLERPGSELLLAWISVLVGWATTKCFMPFILSLHLCILSGTAALVSQTTKDRFAPYLTLGLLSFAPLLTFGALYQLLGQTAGLAMLLGGSTIICCAQGEESKDNLLRLSLLFSIVLCGQLLLYPELLPFLGLSTALLGARLLLSSRVLPPARTILAIALPPLLILTVILRRYLVGAVGFLFQQAQSGVTGYKQAADVFSQYLLPSGIGGLWGFFNIYSQVTEPTLSIGSAIGALLLCLLIAGSLRRAYSADFLSLIFLVMIAVAVFLRVQSSAFGLYKIAMYLQPFLWASFAVFLSRLKYRTPAALLIAPFLCYPLVRTQFDYVSSSRGEADRMNGTFCEIYKGSSTGILSELEVLSTTLDGRSIVSDSSNLVLAKLESAAFIGKRLSHPFFDLFPSKSRHLNILQAPELNAAETALQKAEAGRVRMVSFNMRDSVRGEENQIWIENLSQPEDGVAGPFSLLINTALQTPFNRRVYGDSKTSFHHLPWEEVRNHLMFIDSKLGRLYYSHDRDRIALYQLEPDYFYPGKTMAGIGRHLMFQVIHPSPKVRLLLWMTASLKHDSNNLLPKAEAIGMSREPFPVVGRGSGRFFSPPLEAQSIIGRMYLGVDMGQEGVRWKEQKTGLLKLFESNLQTDPRKLTGFLRDLSLLSEEEYQARKSPSSLKAFPQDFSDPNLEYSGFYEDGWLSERCTAALDAPEPGRPTVLVLRGTVPGITPEMADQELRISIDGAPRLLRKLPPGEFEILLPIAESRSRKHIELSFLHAAPLPGDDMRPVAALLHELSLVSAEDQ